MERGGEGEPEKRERGRGRQGREGSGERGEWNDSMLWFDLEHPQKLIG